MTNENIKLHILSNFNNTSTSITYNLNRHIKERAETEMDFLTPDSRASLYMPTRLKTRARLENVTGIELLKNKM